MSPADLFLHALALWVALWALAFLLGLLPEIE